jgi:hypothetical protein
MFDGISIVSHIKICYQKTMLEKNKLQRAQFCLYTRFVLARLYGHSIVRVVRQYGSKVCIDFDLSYKLLDLFFFR